MGKASTESGPKDEGSLLRREDPGPGRQCPEARRHGPTIGPATVAHLRHGRPGPRTSAAPPGPAVSTPGVEGRRVASGPPESQGVGGRVEGSTTARNTSESSHPGPPRPGSLTGTLPGVVARSSLTPWLIRPTGLPPDRSSPPGSPPPGSLSPWESSSRTLNTETLDFGFVYSFIWFIVLVAESFVW